MFALGFVSLVLNWMLQERHDTCRACCINRSQIRLVCHPVIIFRTMQVLCSGQATLERQALLCSAHHKLESVSSIYITTTRVTATIDDMSLMVCYTIVYYLYHIIIKDNASCIIIYYHFLLVLML